MGIFFEQMHLKSVGEIDNMGSSKRPQGELLNGSWDSLVLLDACRYDVFREVNDIPGELKKVNSKAHSTVQWYKKYIYRKRNHDTVFISNQPWPWENGSFNIENFNFGSQHPLWKRDNWLDFESTVQKVNEILENIDPDKKALIHLLPPHVPYRSPRGKKFMKEELGIEYKFQQEIEKEIENYAELNGWKKIKSVYREEVAYALEKIKSIDPDVISSDHGELIGEQERYGHVVRHPKIRTVPWFEVSHQ